MQERHTAGKRRHAALIARVPFTAPSALAVAEEEEQDAEVPAQREDGALPKPARGRAHGSRTFV